MKKSTFHQIWSQFILLGSISMGKTKYGRPHVHIGEKEAWLQILNDDGQP